MKTTLKIEGTHCNSCKMLIEDIAKDFPGVKSATVDFKTGRAVIEHEGKIDASKLKKEIESAGKYKVSIVK